ncbi:MAG: HDOD domain-containing protein [Burkholderiaceae bacterium]|nr:HDOD domain-containing protein [Burkholderiaceae bacterium]
MSLSTANSLDGLAQIVLADPSMTQRMLRAANSPAYHTRAADPVTTVTRAIMLMGYNATRSTAQGLQTLDDVLEKPFRPLAYELYAEAGLRALLTRNLLYQRHPAVAEEAAIAAMFSVVGKIFVAIHAPQAMAMIAIASEEHAIDESAAARRTIGMSFDELTLELIHAWRMPQKMLAMLRSLPTRPRAPESAAEWVPLAIGYAVETSSALSESHPGEREKALGKVAERYGDAIRFDPDEFTELIADTAEDAGKMDRTIGVPQTVASTARFMQAHLRKQVRSPALLPEVFSPAIGGGTGDGGAAANESGEKPADAGERLVRIIDALRPMFESQSDSSLLMPLVLTGVRRAMRYRRVVWFARDLGAGRFQPRIALGTDLESMRSRARMTIPYAPDLFHAALAQDVDLHIGNTMAEKVASRLPAWFANAMTGAGSFLILPVRVQDTPVGFIYADRESADPDGPNEAELNLLRELRDLVASGMSL